MLFRLPCIAARPFDVGQSVTVALRYEKVGLAKGISGECIVPGKVTERIYLGSVVRIETTIANGKKLTADVVDTDRAQGIELDDEIKLGFLVTAAVIVDD